MSQVTLGAVAGGYDIGDFDVTPLATGARTLVNGSLIRITTSDGWTHEILGSGFQQSGGQITAGLVSGYRALQQGALAIEITGASLPAASVFSWISGHRTEDFLTGFLGGADVITGSAAGDVFMGLAGDDRFTGGGGVDIFQGGAGLDTAVYAGARAGYTVTLSSGRTTVDSHGAEAFDALFNVEALQFADATLNLGLVDAATLGSAQAILRTQATATDAALDVGNGLRSRAAAVDALVDQADATSSVATLAYQFFTGRTPGAAGMDYLVSPTGPNPNNLNSDYYQTFNLENRYINFAVNLGKQGEGRAGFTAEYGALSLFEATRQAYAEVFGAAPSDAKVHALLDPTLQLGGVTLTRAEYFEYYGQDGENGVGTKAAMVGWLMAEAVKADVGLYARANDAFLTDVGLNGAPFGVDLIGAYGRDDYIFGG